MGIEVFNLKLTKMQFLKEHKAEYSIKKINKSQYINLIKNNKKKNLFQLFSANSNLSLNT